MTSKLRLISSDRGSTTAVVSFVVTAAMVAYLKVGRPLVLEIYGPMYDSAALGILGIISFFTICGVSHVLFFSQHKDHAIRSEVKSRAERLRHITVKAQKNLAHLEERLAGIDNGVLPPDSVNNFRSARRNNWSACQTI